MCTVLTQTTWGRVVWPSLFGGAASLGIQEGDTVPGPSKVFQSTLENGIRSIMIYVFYCIFLSGDPAFALVRHHL